MTEAASMPMSTAPFTPFLASSTMTNRPTNRVTTDSTMVGYALPMVSRAAVAVSAPKKSFITKNWLKFSSAM